VTGPEYITLSTEDLLTLLDQAFWAGRRVRHYGSTPEGFWAKVQKTAACWLWIGATDHGGYGRIKIEGRWIGAHCRAWELTHGPIPLDAEGNPLHVLHNCPNGDNRLCVNPAHLWVGTRSDNMIDRYRKRRAR
jgi:hypothetical protein